MNYIWLIRQGIFHLCQIYERNMNDISWKSDKFRDHMNNLIWKYKSDSKIGIIRQSPVFVFLIVHLFIGIRNEKIWILIFRSYRNIWQIWFSDLLMIKPALIGFANMIIHNQLLHRHVPGSECSYPKILRLPFLWKWKTIDLLFISQSSDLTDFWIRSWL